MKKILPFLLLLIIACSGCRTIRETQTEYLTVHHTDTLREIRTQRDSIYFYEKETTTQRGDTVFVDRWHYMYKDRAKTDTVYQVKTVTITQRLYYTKEKEINRLRWWQKVLMWIGGISCVLAIGYGAFKFGKFKFS